MVHGKPKLDKWLAPGLRFTKICQSYYDGSLSILAPSPWMAGHVRALVVHEPRAGMMVRLGIWPVHHWKQAEATLRVKILGAEKQCNYKCHYTSSLLEIVGRS